MTKCVSGGFFETRRHRLNRTRDGLEIYRDVSKPQIASPSGGGRRCCDAAATQRRLALLCVFAARPLSGVTACNNRAMVPSRPLFAPGHTPASLSLSLSLEVAFSQQRGVGFVGWSCSGAAACWRLSGWRPSSRARVRRHRFTLTRISVGSCPFGTIELVF